MDRAGLYFLPNNVTMRESNYINVLKEHLLAFWRIHQFDHFMHDGAPAHKSKIVTNFLNDVITSMFESGLETRQTSIQLKMPGIT